VPELWANEREVLGETFVHPWRRFFARHLDLVLMAFALGMINGAVFEENSPAGRLLNNGGVMMLLAIVLFVPVEAILLATWGSTTGKALYGIRIKRDDAGALSFGEALSRSFDVSARGLGFGLPLVSWVTLFLGYKTLRDTKKTSWDSRLELSVRHARIGVGRAIAIGAVWAGILALMALGIYATDSGF